MVGGLVVGLLAGCSSGVPGYLARQAVPYVEVDGRPTTLGGEAGVIGMVRGPVSVQVGHKLVVKPGRIAWPKPRSSDQAILRKVGEGGLGVFVAVKAGTASLLMSTPDCVRPLGSSCILVDVLVTDRPVAATTSTPTVEPTTSVINSAND
jgi:hypothetical protein